VVADGGVVGQRDGVVGGVDGCHLGAQPQVDVVVAVPGGGVDGEIGERLLAGQILLG